MQLKPHLFSAYLICPPSFSMHCIASRIHCLNRVPQTPLLQPPHRQTTPQRHKHSPVFRPVPFWPLVNTTQGYCRATIRGKLPLTFSDSTGFHSRFFDKHSSRGRSHWSFDLTRSFPRHAPVQLVLASISRIAHLTGSNNNNNNNNNKAEGAGRHRLWGIADSFRELSSCPSLDYLLHNPIILVYASVNILSSDRVQPFTHALSNLQ